MLAVKQYNYLKKYFNDPDKLLAFIKSTINNGKISKLYIALTNISKSKLLKDKVVFDNFILLENSFSNNIKGYKRIINETNYDKYLFILDKIIIEQDTFKKWEKPKINKIIKNNKTEDEKLRDNIKKLIIKNKIEYGNEKKLIHLKKEKEIIKYINGELSIGDINNGISSNELKEILNKDIVYFTLDENQYARYKRLLTLYSDNQVLSLEEFNKIVNKSKKIIGKSFNQGTFIIYNRNGC